jgi:DNA-binding NarL/FixJ family response regulator
MTVRVVLAEDNFLVREGIRQLIEAQPEVELVGVCSDLPELESAVAALQPDVVVTDIRMPPDHSDEGLRFAHDLRGTNPGIGVVVLSQFAEPEYALTLLDGGAAGRAYLLKDRVSNVDQLMGAVREVARGGSVIDPTVVELLVAARRPRSSPIEQLTPREREVLQQLAEGRNNAAIGAALSMSERAVEKHINAIFSKLELSEEPLVHRRVKAALTYLAATRS